MPTYCYRREGSGKLVEIIMSISEMERRQKRGRIVLSDGVGAIRDVSAEHGHFRDTPGNWPMKSVAMGVNPQGIGQARQNLKKMGVEVEFERDGRMKLNNLADRKRVCEAMGVHDKDAGYGDP